MIIPPWIHSNVIISITSISIIAINLWSYWPTTWPISGLNLSANHLLCHCEGYDANDGVKVQRSAMMWVHFFEYYEGFQRCPWKSKFKWKAIIVCFWVSKMNSRYRTYGMEFCIFFGRRWLVSGKHTIYLVVYVVVLYKTIKYSKIKSEYCTKRKTV